ncbi:MAG TPA: hypothetical protein VEL07_20485 [Planctomycetota bacterium]|nr:hypothetical protein [Planctomycetota bacterium]
MPRRILPLLCTYPYLRARAAAAVDLIAAIEEVDLRDAPRAGRRRRAHDRVVRAAGRARVDAMHNPP